MAAAIFLEIHGIGTFGKKPTILSIFSSELNERYWQVLPLTTTSYGDSLIDHFLQQLGSPYIDLKILKNLDI